MHGLIILHLLLQSSLGTIPLEPTSNFHALKIVSKSVDNIFVIFTDSSLSPWYNNILEMVGVGSCKTRSKKLINVNYIALVFGFAKRMRSTCKFLRN